MGLECSIRIYLIKSFLEIMIFLVIDMDQNKVKAIYENWNISMLRWAIE